MKLPCSVIQDLLPLYAEDLTSDVSKALVEEHLPECDDCRKMLAELKAPPPALPPEAVPMQQVKKLLRKQLWLAVVLTVCIATALFSVFIGWMLRDTPIPYSAESIVIQENEDGSIDAIFDQPLGWAWHSLQQDGETGLFYIELFCEGAPPIYQWINPVDTYVLRLVEPDEHCDYIVYENNAVDGEHILIWGQLPPGHGQGYTLHRLTLNYYSLLALTAALLTGLVWLLLRKQKGGTVFAGLSVLSLCYLAGHLFIAGNHNIIYTHMPRYFILICLCTLALFGVFCTGLSLYRLRKDK